LLDHKTIDRLTAARAGRELHRRDRLRCEEWAAFRPPFLFA
jgi:hypothetical protein